MTIDDLKLHLGEELQDPAEETFLLFSQQPVDSQNLGFIDPRAQSVQVAVHGRDFTIHQSPSMLSSHRAGGTTGAVLWKITPLFAEFLSSPSNLFFSAGILSPSSSVLELGCGISPLTGLALRPHISHYLLTDQSYVQRLIVQNINENTPAQSSSSKKKAVKEDRGKHSAPKQQQKAKQNQAGPSTADVVRFETLDWETDEVTPSLSPTGDFDLVIACDCVYNDALVRPLVQTCVDACALRTSDDGADESTICVVAQQLRSDEVFEQWLTEFHRHFHVWRIPDGDLLAGIRSDTGFVIHVGILRDS